MIATSSRVSPRRLVVSMAIAGLIALFAADSPAAVGKQHHGEIAGHAIWSDASGAQCRQSLVDIGATPAEAGASRQPAVAEGVEGSGSDHDAADTAHDGLSRTAALDRRRHGISAALAKLPANADPFLARGPPRV